MYGSNAGLPSHLCKVARQSNEPTSARCSRQIPAQSAPGAPGHLDLDQLREVEARIDALVQINKQQVDRLEEVQLHNACCLCTVDAEAAFQYLSARKQRIDKLEQEMRSVGESIGAVRAATCGWKAWWRV